MSLEAEHTHTLRYISVEMALLKAFYMNKLKSLNLMGMSMLTSLTTCASLGADCLDSSSHKKMWIQALTYFIIKMGFVKCKSNHCVSFKLHNDAMTFVVLYMVYLIAHEAKTPNSVISHRIKFADFGEVKNFLFVETKRKYAASYMTCAQLSFSS